MRDSYIREALSNIGRFKRELRSSFTSYRNGGEARQYDIVYNLKGLTVYVEAKLAEREARRNSSEGLREGIIKTTPEEAKIYQKKYEEKLEKARKKYFKENKSEKLPAPFNKGKVLFLPKMMGIDIGINSVKGVLINSIEDNLALSATATSVRTEYTGIDLGEYIDNEEWNYLIEELRKHYKINTSSASEGIADIIRRPMAPGIIHPHPIIEAKSLHFSSEITRPRDINIIREVYNAGRDLETAIQKELSKKKNRISQYVGSSNKR